MDVASLSYTIPPLIFQPGINMDSAMRAWRGFLTCNTHSPGKDSATDKSEVAVVVFTGMGRKRWAENRHPGVMKHCRLQWTGVGKLLHQSRKAAEQTLVW